MPDPSPLGRRTWLPKLLAGALVAGSVSATAGFWVMKRVDAVATPEADPAPAQVGGVPLFATWPQGATPDAVLVLSGQTYGYMSPCGCSRPQKGGLERRANFMDSLRAKGWYVVGLDLGDVTPVKGPTKHHVPEQDLLKYQYTMKALAEMGYAAVGLGEYDFNAQLFELLGRYALPEAGKPPAVLAANLAGVKTRDAVGKVTAVFTREEYFPGADPKGRPMVDAGLVVESAGRPAVGVTGVIGLDVEKQIEKIDKQFAFLDNGVVLKGVLDEWSKRPAEPAVKVLMYAGDLKQAKLVAQALPKFQIILCQSTDAEPPQFATAANGGNTLIVQVGHKGQNVGVVGLFRRGAGFELKYQLVPLGEEYLTPPGAEAAKKSKVLGLMEDYAAEVRKKNLLALYSRNPQQHPAQLQQPDANLSFVGSAACQNCHQAEYQAWAASAHSHSYEALDADSNRPVDHKATRPSNRQFDGECVVCHVTGFEYKTGFTSAAATPNLLNNGCENCHGPGSGHVAMPTKKEFLSLLSPWKSAPDDKLPDVATMNKIAALPVLQRGSVQLPPNQIQTMNNVSQMCMRCHDQENDPKFELTTYMPKIYHSNLKNAAAGLPRGAK